MTSCRVRVVRVVPALDFGGVERIVETQSALIDRERFDFRVCTFHLPGSTAARIRDTGEAVDVLGVDPHPANPFATLALARYLRTLRPDMIHSSVMEANFHTFLTRGLFRPRAWVVQEVGLSEPSMPIRIAHGLIFRHATLTLGDSHAVVDQVRRLGAPAPKSVVLPNCARAEFFRMRDQAPAGPVRVLAVGRLVPEKNFTTLLRSFAVALEAHPKALLQIAGEGPERRRLESLIGSLGISDSVELLGARDEIKELLDQAHAFVLPSVSEGQGIALVEAMGSGLPVLGSTAGGIPEVLHGYDAFAPIDPHDVTAWARALVEIIGMTSAERHEIGLTANAVARARYAPSQHMEKLTELYDRALASEVAG